VSRPRRRRHRQWETVSASASPRSLDLRSPTPARACARGGPLTELRQSPAHLADVRSIGSIRQMEESHGHQQSQIQQRCRQAEGWYRVRTHVAPRCTHTDSDHHRVAARLRLGAWAVETQATVVSPFWPLPRRFGAHRPTIGLQTVTETAAKRLCLACLVFTAHAPGGRCSACPRVSH